MKDQTVDVSGLVSEFVQDFLELIRTNVQSLLRSQLNDGPRGRKAPKRGAALEPRAGSPKRAEAKQAGSKRQAGSKQQTVSASKRPAPGKRGQAAKRGAEPKKQGRAVKKASGGARGRADTRKGSKKSGRKKPEQLSLFG